MDLDRLFVEYLRKVENLDRPAQHRSFTLMLTDARYEWGSENLYGTDCSGTLSWPLLCMGHNVRVTAEEFRQNIYVHHVHQPSRYQHRVMAAFFLKERKAKHVMPIVGENVVLDAAGPAGMVVALKDANTAIEDRIQRGYSVEIRELDWGQVHANSNQAWGVDDLILHLRGLL